VLFLFLGLPGAVLAELLTAAVAAAGGQRRRREYALLSMRGPAPGSCSPWPRARPRPSAAPEQ
jgi:putative ABC transport system permease protein